MWVTAIPGTGTSYHAGMLRNLRNCSHLGSEELSILPTVTQHFLTHRSGERVPWLGQRRTPEDIPFPLGTASCPLFLPLLKDQPLKDSCPGPKLGQRLGRARPEAYSD